MAGVAQAATFAWVVGVLSSGTQYPEGEGVVVCHGGCVVASFVLVLFVIARAFADWIAKKHGCSESVAVFAGVATGVGGTPCPLCLGLVGGASACACVYEFTASWLGAGLAGTGHDAPSSTFNR